MKTTSFLKNVVMAGALAFVVVACNKENVSVSDNDTMAEDNQVVQDETENIYAYQNELWGGFANARESATDSVGKPKKMDKCATITSTTSNGVVTTVIDFGAPHECDGVKVGGKITISMPAKPSPSSSGLFNQTFVYENLVRGTRTINGKHNVNLTLENGKPVLKENFTEATITKEDGNIIKFTSTKSRKVDTKNTVSPADDEATITGVTTAVGSDGNSFSSTITKALVIKSSCSGTVKRFPVIGTVEIERTGKAKKVIDYGNGTCDLVYTVDGVEKTRK